MEVVMPRTRFEFEKPIMLVMGDEKREATDTEAQLAGLAIFNYNNMSMWMGMALERRRKHINTMAWLLVSVAANLLLCLGWWL